MEAGPQSDASDVPVTRGRGWDTFEPREGQRAQPVSTPIVCKGADMKRLGHIRLEVHEVSEGGAIIEAHIMSDASGAPGVSVLGVSLDAVLKELPEVVHKCIRKEMGEDASSD